MAGLAIAATVLSGVVSAVGTIAAGNQAAADADFRAKQLEQKGNEERAVAQRQMFERRRDGEFQQSRLRAVAGAASGDTTDSGVLKLGSDIAQRTEYQALTEMYKGENAARGYEDSAMAARATGKAQQQGSYFKAFGSILETGGSALKMKYGVGKGAYF